MRQIIKGEFGSLEVVLDSDDADMAAIVKLAFMVMTVAALKPERREEAMEYLVSIMEDWADKDQLRIKPVKSSPDTKKIVDDLLKDLKNKGDKNGKDR